MLLFQGQWDKAPASLFLFVGYHRAGGVQKAPKIATVVSI